MSRKSAAAAAVVTTAPVSIPTPSVPTPPASRANPGGGTLFLPFVVENTVAHRRYHAIALRSLDTLKRGDPGFVGGPTAFGVTAATESELAGFQLGVQVDVTFLVDQGAGTPALTPGQYALGGYEVVRKTEYRDHATVGLERADGLRPGDPGYFGLPEQVRLGVGLALELAEFQPGRKVWLVLDATGIQAPVDDEAADPADAADAAAAGDAAADLG